MKRYRIMLTMNRHDKKSTFTPQRTVLLPFLWMSWENGFGGLIEFDTETKAENWLLNEMKSNPKTKFREIMR